MSGGVGKDNGGKMEDRGARNGRAGVGVGGGVERNNQQIRLRLLSLLKETSAVFAQHSHQKTLEGNGWKIFTSSKYNV